MPTMTDYCKYTALLEIRPDCRRVTPAGHTIAFCVVADQCDHDLMWTAIRGVKPLRKNASTDAIIEREKSIFRGYRIMSESINCH